MNIIKYFSLVTLCFIVPVICAKAQRNFKPGYVVGLKGDTTKGLVDYKEWNMNPRAITFKANDQTSIQQLSVSDITAFGIMSLDEYRRYVGPVTMNTVETRNLIYLKDTTVVRDTVFLKQIATGKYLTLLEYTDFVKDRFFVSEANTPPVELKYYRYFSKENTAISEDTYRQQLQRFVARYHSGNLDLIEKVQGSNYTQKHLQKVVDAINEVSTGGLTNSSSGSATQFFAGLAANVNTFGFKEPGVTSKSSVFPQLNLGVNVFLNKNVRRAIFRTEINITGSKAETSESRSEQKITFNQFTATLLPQFIYNVYNTDKLKAFFGAGLGFNFNKYTDIKYFIGSYQKKDVDFETTYMSVAAKAGVSFKKIEIYAGYSQPLTAFAEASVKRYSFQLGINYSF